MKHTRPLRAVILTVLLALPAMAQADCYADYKAKRDTPLRLHYGIAKISGACSRDAARAELKPRLAADGWTLLTVLSVFDDAGLAERRDSAGQYYLRY
ncbi:hypothetical protein [Primorskyibacter sedentarius]|uniref:DUF4177 domain-containing protein n=1 Tax=Primorskyibacter sedentarius TaxID=745311 RepID=A0A4V2UPX0_9RHOB|nr:hypothetical protein [Primorskyibacter sedentarius]TCS67640.1 hypothetical protein EDD52_101743 [Primorskyibacter sedentarius]